MPDDTKLVMDCSDPMSPPAEVPLTAEDKTHQAQGAAIEATRRGIVTFESGEDDERLALVAERGQADPAFAALADLALARRTP